MFRKSLTFILALYTFPSLAAICASEINLNATAIPLEERVPWLPSEAVAVIGTSKAHHWGAVLSLHVGGDGAYFISTGDRVIQWWDSANLQAIDSVSEEGKSLAGIVFSPDGKHAASSGRLDGMVILWKITSEGNRKKLIATDQKMCSRINRFCFSPDSKSLVVGGDNGRLFIFTISDNKLAELFEHKNGNLGFSSLAFSPNGKVLIAAGASEMTVLNLGGENPSIKQTASHHKGWITGLAFAPTGGKLVSGDTEGNLILWKIEADKMLIIGTTKSDSEIRGLVISNDAQNIYSVDEAGNVTESDKSNVRIGS